MRPLSLPGLLVAASAFAEPPLPPTADCFTGPAFIFFDWGSDELTPGARAILDNVLLKHRVCAADTLLTVEGHADRSGPEPYNLALSRRRAERVRAYLAGRGIPDPALTATAYGEDRPLVGTPDGVPEPQNRYVTVNFHHPNW